MNQARCALEKVVSTPPSAVALEQTLSEDAIRQAVNDLNAICRSATLSFTLAVGEFVFKRFYAGDAERWRCRDPNKHDSLRRLARHPDLAMSAGTLYRSVAMYELAHRIRISEYRRISTTHLRLVLPLLPPQQERLLRDTEAGGWSVRRLEEEVAALVRRDPAQRTQRGGRKRHCRLQQAVRATQQCMVAFDEFATLEEGEDAPSVEAVREALAALRETFETAARLKRRLEQYLPNAQTSPPPAHDKVRVVGPR